MNITNPTIKHLTQELGIETTQAKAVKWLMNNYHDIPEAFNCYGHLIPDYITGIAYTKLKAVEDSFTNAWQGPTNIPRGTVENALLLIDKLLNTHGVEHDQFKDKESWKIDLQYCNAGDMYANTLYYSSADNAFCLGSWADAVEFYTSQGYKRLEEHEMTY